MSNTKHLADLLKICSFLPALVIMPAMAETEIIEERLNLTADKIYQTDVLADGVVGSQGGVFYVGKDVGLVFQDDATFKNNVAQGKNVHGGAIYNEGRVDFADDATFSGNKTYSGGGAIRNLASGLMTFNGDAEFDGNLVLYSKDNSVGGSGAAINNNGKIVFNGDATFKNNSALDRKDSYSQGGAIYNGGELVFNGTAKFTGNASYNKGSVIENTAAGKITFNKGLVVSGNGTDLTGNSSNSINNSGTMNISGGDVIITNNNTGGIAGISTGGVLNIDAGDSGKILFENNTTRDSIVGLYSSGSETTLLADLISFKNNVQTSNTDKVYGGAVYNGGAGSDQGVLKLLAKNIVFEGNTLNGFQDGHKKIGGAALYNRGGGDSASVTETFVGLADGTSTILFKNNSSAQHGGAIFGRTDDGTGFDAQLTLTGNVEFSGNSAGEDGGAIMNWTDGRGGLTDINIVGNVSFENNIAGKSGGAIFNSGTVDLSKAVAEFEGNIAKGNYGGAIYNAASGKFVNLTAEFEENKVQNDDFAAGGAIANIGKIAELTGDFEENSVLATTDNVITSAKGGAIYTFAGSTIDSIVADFDGNFAISGGEAMGGAIVNDGKIGKLHQLKDGFVNNKVDAKVYAWAGALYNSQGASIDELKADFTANSVKGALWSVGGAVLNYGTVGTLTGNFINNSVVATEQDGSALGGAILNFDTIQALSGNFIGNTASAATAEYAMGGAIENYSGTINVVGDNLFHKNMADYGGAIDNNDVLNLTGKNVFTGNKANYDGGAIYNAGTLNLSGEIIFADNVHGKYNAANDIVNEGALNITAGTTTFGGGVKGTGDLVLVEGAILNIGTTTIHQGTINLQGTVIASLVNNQRGNGYGRFVGDITVGANAMFELNVGAVGTYNIWDGNVISKDQIIVSDIYEIANIDTNGVQIVTKSVEKVAQDVGLSTQAAGVVVSMANSNVGKSHQISLALQDALNSGDVEFVEAETKKLNPTDKPVAQAAATSVQNQILSLASGRMSGGMAVGRAGGDEATQENGFWIQGLFNKSKFADKFHGYTRGVALGADTLIDKTWTLGGGLAFNNADVYASGVHTNIDSKTLFLYGQYQPGKWFVNSTLTYNMSEYTNAKTVAGIALSNTYDVDSYGAQIMTGFDFATGITTEAGLRYLHIAQEAYTDELGNPVGEMNNNFLSGVAGVKYAFEIENDWAIQLRPELRAAMTYDFVSDDAVATVVLPGVASYKVATDRLSRLGGEFGIGLTALYKGMEISVMYDLDLHQDYTSQTGMIKFRGKF